MNPEKNNAKKRRRNNQRGEILIIITLVSMIFFLMTVIATTQMIRSEKKRTRSTAVSASAFQKAEEAMECTLWARNEVHSNCSSLVNPQASMIYVYSIIEDPNAYCKKYENEIRLGSSAATRDDIPRCASPLYIGAASSKGSDENPTTKTRGLAATVEKYPGPLFVQNVCCNKVAAHGELLDQTCVGEDNLPKPPDGPDGMPDFPDFKDITKYSDDMLNSTWLKYWGHCATPCQTDECAYYNTELGEDIDSDGVNDTGANWCFTYYNNTADRPVLSRDETSSACSCLGSHTINASDLKYWKHTKIAEMEFCHPCKRLDENRPGASATACDGAGTGKICGDMASTLEAAGLPFSGANSLNPNVWGGADNADIIPTSLDEAGILVANSENNDTFSCMCYSFWDANENWCIDHGYPVRPE